MKNALFLLLFTIGFLASYPQAPKDTAKNKPDVVIHLKPGETAAFRQIQVNDKNEIVLDEIPTQMEFVFPPTGFSDFSIRFNKKAEKGSFTIAFQCKEQNCEQILLTDINNGKLILSFSNGHLTKIGDRTITGRSLTAKHPYLQIEGAQVKKPDTPTVISVYDLELKGKQEVLFIDTSLIKNALKCFTCDDMLEECLNCDSARNGDSFIRSPFKQRLEKATSNAFLGNAITYRYRIVYDHLADTLYYLKLKRTWFKNYEYYKVKKAINPGAKREVLLQIIGKKDSAYSVSVNDTHFFLEGQSAFAGVLNKALEGLKEQKPDAEGKQNGFTKPIDGPLHLNGTNPCNLCDTLLLSLIERKLISLTPEECQILENQHDSVKNVFCKMLGQYDSLTRVNSILRDSIRLSREVLEQLPDAVDIKAKFLALDMALEIFNHRFRSIDCREGEYQRALICLMLRIKKCLQIPVTFNAKEFAASLVSIVKARVPDSFHGEFVNVIKAIEYEFNKAINIRSSLTVINKSIRVPDADQFTMEVGVGKEKNQVFKRDFDISGGFKIDFGTGVFFTGLGSREYLIAPSFFSYTDTTGGLNRIRDTSGSLIRVNYSSLTYGVGFFSHGYIRTGTFFNAGLSTGLLINNTGNILVTGGGCIMFNSAGKNRFSVVGGVAFGRQRVLSNSVAESRWEPYKDYENGRIVFANKSELPRFYQAENSSEVPTYERWNSSYFFGLTYNFASTK